MTTPDATPTARPTPAQIAAVRSLLRRTGFDPARMSPRRCHIFGNLLGIPRDTVADCARLLGASAAA